MIKDGKFEISEKEFRLVYTGFVILFAANLVINYMQYVEQRKIRKIQRQIEEEKLYQIKNGK
jgi:cell division protein FtsL